MARLRLPAYVNVRKLSDGTPAYYWIRPKWASPPNLRHGKPCPVESSPLGINQGAAITKAEALNAAFKEWREGEASARTPGTVKWLFSWYCQQEKFTALRHSTRKGYRFAMDQIEAMDTKGGPLGGRKAAAVDATVSDALYRKARAKHGERQASYMMQVCRLVWNQARRPGYSKSTGVKDNPFSGMGIKASTGGKGNRAATRAEYDLYRATARELGKQSMATAAALLFECCQRV
ncbi:hypothetical protein [Sphingomonas montanisoli]|uniref:Integrase n=1 Tax=Sphingomonas montanisoli TaxID=2606412 RepID=A0A5D9BZR3_9SPHN|nr:hypothetical protein [Sphingomonas montanisoli]TZG24906.1 hypothetical protein FYJ91_16635 [Sphingomonas montanisoli]